MPQTTTAFPEEAVRAAGEDLRARTAASHDLAELAVRLRRAASVVSDQAEVHRALLVLDWHGSAASAFSWAVRGRVAMLERLVDELHVVADAAARRAAEGAALRAAAGWAA